MPLYLIEGPTVLAVSVVDTKAHLRVDTTDDDDLIDALIEACTQHIEGRDGWLRRALVAQTWELRSEAFCGPIEIPLPPLISVESIKHYDADNALQTVSTSLYDVVGAGGGSKGKIILNSGESWPTVYPRSEAVIVRFRAGYVDTSDSPPTGDIPAPIVAALKMMVSTLYEHRETVLIGQTVVQLPWAAEALLAPYRIYE